MVMPVSSQAASLTLVDACIQPGSQFHLAYYTLQCSAFFFASLRQLRSSRCQAVWAVEARADSSCMPVSLSVEAG